MFFIKLPKHKVFEYQPLYYDAEKERREKRRKELGLADDEDSEIKAGTGDLLRSGAMRARHEGFMQDMEDDTRRSIVRRITFMVILGGLIYFLVCGKLDLLVNFFFSK